MYLVFIGHHIVKHTLGFVYPYSEIALKSVERKGEGHLNYIYYCIRRLTENLGQLSVIFCFIANSV